MAVSTLLGRHRMRPGLRNRSAKLRVGLCLRIASKLVQAIDVREFIRAIPSFRFAYFAGLRSAMSSNSDFAGTGAGVSRTPPSHDGLRLLLQTTLDAVVVMTA